MDKLIEKRKVAVKTLVSSKTQRKPAVKKLVSSKNQQNPDVKKLVSSKKQQKLVTSRQVPTCPSKSITSMNRLKILVLIASVKNIK